MAEQSTGVKYAISIDDTALRKAAQESAKAFEDIASQAVRSGDKMDSIFDKAAASAAGAVDDFASLSDQIKFQKDIIAGLEKDLKVLEEAYKNAAPGRDWADAVSKFNSAKAELLGEKQALEELEAQAKSTANSQVSMRTRMREVREELIALEAAGKRGTEEYRKLQEEAGELQDAYADASAQMRIMAHDQRGLQGIISGLTGLSAAFSAASGVVGLFTKDNEKLQQAMLRVQSLMSITVGLQQIQQTLNKDSAFRLVVINGLKDYWVRVTEKSNKLMAVQAAMTKKAGVAANTSAGMFKKLAVAIRSTAAGPIAAVLAVLTAIILIVRKIIKNEKQVSGELKRQHSLIKGIQESRIEAQKATMKDAMALENSVKRLKTMKTGTDEYKRTVKEVADTLGVQASWLEKNVGLTEQLAKMWIKVKVAQSTGDAYLSRASNLKVNTEDAINKLKNMNTQSKEAKALLMDLGIMSEKQVDAYLKFLHNVKKSGGAAYGLSDEQVWKQVEKEDDKIRALAQQQADKFVKYYNQELDSVANEVNSLAAAQRDSDDWKKQQEDRQNAIKKEKTDREKAIEDAKKDIEEGNKALAKIIEDGQKEIDETAVATMEEGNKKRLAEIRSSYDERMKAIARIEEDIKKNNRKIAAAEAAVRGDKNFDASSIGLTDAQNKFISNLKKAAEDMKNKGVNDVYDEIISKTESYEQKRNKIIKEYADQRAVLEELGLEENIKELNKQERDALNSLAKNEAQKKASYLAWVNSINVYALNELESLLEQVKEELKTAEEQGDTPENVAVLTAKISVLTEQIDKLKAELDEAGKVKNALAPRNEEIQRWETIRATVYEISGTLNSIVNEFDGLSDATREWVSVILETSEQFLDNFVEAKKAAAESGKSMNMSSFIDELSNSGTLLTMVVKVFMAAIRLIIKLTKKGNEDFYNDVVGRFDDAISLIEKRMDVAYDNLYRITKDNGKIYDKFGNSYDSLTDALVSNFKNIDDWVKTTDRDVNELDADFRDMLNSITLPYSQMKAYGLDYYTEMIRQAELYERKIATSLAAIKKYEEQRDKAVLQKNKDKWQEKIDELQEGIEEDIVERSRLLAEMVEQIFGNSAEGIASQFGDALISAFESGEDAARAFDMTVSDIMKNVVKNFLVKKYLEGQMAWIFDDMQAMQDNGWSMDEILNRLKAYFDMLQEGVDGMEREYSSFASGLGWDQDAIDAASRGIAAASQDSIDELNGRMTVIQAHTHAILESSALCANNTSGILNAVRNISSDTANMKLTLGRIDNRLARIEETITL